MNKVIDDNRVRLRNIKLSNKEIPIYYMDTITGCDKDGNELVPTHYLPLTRREVRRRRKSYLANKSQVEDLPTGELNDVFDVLAMPKRRGKDIGVRFAAAAIFEPAENGLDPLVDIFKENIIIFDRSKIIR